MLLLLVAGCIWKMCNLNGSVVKQVFITAIKLLKKIFYILIFMEMSMSKIM